MSVIRLIDQVSLNNFMSIISYRIKKLFRLHSFNVQDINKFINVISKITDLNKEDFKK